MAIRDIQPGEEICISYVSLDDCCDDDEEVDGEEDEEMASGNAMASSSSQPDVEERRRILREFYLFDCRCVKCQQELEQVGK